MCGRYYFGKETAEYVHSVSGRIEESASFRTGDIRPSEPATIMTGMTQDISVADMRWGFHSYMSKQLIINARSETAFEKKTFAESMRKYRCVIPAQYFYEWNRNGEIVRFSVPGRRIICMAGIYRQFEDGYRFTILTTGANDSMRPVHDRMPVIIDENMARDWLFDTEAAHKILKAEKPELDAYQEFEQMSLF